MKIKFFKGYFLLYLNEVAHTYNCETLCSYELNEFRLPINILVAHELRAFYYTNANQDMFKVWEALK